MTIEALAARAGEMSAVYLGGIERGDNANPTIGVLQRIADALSVEPTALLDLYGTSSATELRKIARKRINGLTQDELRRLLRVLDAIR
jgi:transcriptional regulator with XRE-family HTH domain